MKHICLILILGLFFSCSSSQEKKRLADKVQEAEVRSFEEIKSHAQLLVNEHSELDEKTKAELTQLLETSLNKQQELKDQESKVIQLLLIKSLAANKLSDQDRKDKNALKLRLDQIYDQKSSNILDLVKKIVKLSKKNMIGPEFRDDFIIFMREFR